MEKVKKLLNKEVIVKGKSEFGHCISGLFTRDKKDNTKVNKKNLNQSLKYKHFKFESIQNLLNMIEPGVFVSSIDLKVAFFSVPIDKYYQKFLNFFVLSKITKKICLHSKWLWPCTVYFYKNHKSTIHTLKKERSCVCSLCRWQLSAGEDI